jgi:hypothetical protein
MDLTRGHRSNPPATTTQTEENMFMPCKKAIPVSAEVLAACSAGSDPSARITGTSATLNSGEGVELQAQGAGVVDLSAALVPNMDFQFIATRRSDGTVTGHFRFSRESSAGLHEFEGDVTCVTNDVNFPGRARIGGIVTENNSTAPASLTTNHEVGDDVWFRVQDDVGGATFESSTTLGFKPTLVNTSAEYCALPFTGSVPGSNPPVLLWNPGSIFPLVHGQIRVSP